jgi:hypothetical protein
MIRRSGYSSRHLRTALQQRQLNTHSTAALLLLLLRLPHTAIATRWRVPVQAVLLLLLRCVWVSAEAAQGLCRLLHLLLLLPLLAPLVAAARTDQVGLLALTDADMGCIPHMFYNSVCSIHMVSWKLQRGRVSTY